MLNISADEAETLNQIFTLHLSEQDTVLAFGSRTTESYKPYSDLDLVILPATPLALSKLFRIQDALEESSLPYRVDLLDWNRISPTFREVIKKHNTRLWPA